MFWVANNKYICSLFPKTSIDVIERLMFNDLKKSDVNQMIKMDHLELENYLFRKGLNYLKEDPSRFLKGSIIKAISALSLSYNPQSSDSSRLSKTKTLIYRICYLPVFIVGSIGIILNFKKNVGENIIISVYYLSLIFMSMIFWSHTRHTIPYHFTFIYGALLLMIRLKVDFSRLGG
jgi:hypothetical protein